MRFHGVSRGEPCKTWARQQNGKVSQYDNDNYLTRAGDITIQRNSQNGLLTGSTIDSLTSIFSYNDFGKLKDYKETYNTTELFSVQYNTDGLGRITKKIEKTDEQTNTFDYSYNKAGWLTDVTQNNVKIATYSYDTNGNRVSYTDKDSTTSATFDAQDRITKYGNSIYTYTVNGELQSKTNGNQKIIYAYDLRGNLKNVTLPDGKKIEYVVDGINRRIGKKVDGALFQSFLYINKINPIAELNENGDIKSTFVYGAKTNIPDYMIKDGKKYRIISDHLGSPRIVVNTSTGEITQRIEYDTFGNITEDTNPGFQPFGFAGGIYDQDTKLTRFGARDYDAEIGRWITKDPIGFAGGDSNLYGYVMNDPVNMLDPEGLSWLDWDLTPYGDFASGFGSALTWGLTDFINEMLGAGQFVDKCSGLYKAGEWTGIGFSTTFGGASGLKGVVKKKGQEFSHFIPDRFFKNYLPSLRENFGKSLLNGNYVDKFRHVIHDPFRLVKDIGKHHWVKQTSSFNKIIDRIPQVYPNAGFGFIYGWIGSLMDGKN